MPGRENSEQNRRRGWGTEPPALCRTSEDEMPAPGALTVVVSRAARRGRGMAAGFIALILSVWLAAAAFGDPVSPQCLWTPPWLPRAAPPGMVSIQYLLLSGSQIMDDPTAATIAQSLGPD